jgi:hypothetical protein
MNPAGVDPFQRAAWQAAIVGAILGLIQLCLGLWKQLRDARVERAKFGYQLLDDLFDDDAAGEMLDALDSFSDSATKRNTEGLEIFFAGLFGSDAAARSIVTGDQAANVHIHIDALLFFLDRFEHAIRAKLTSQNVLETPIAYYEVRLRPYRPALSNYMRRTGFKRALAFLKRFDTGWT